MYTFFIILTVLFPISYYTADNTSPAVNISFIKQNYQAYEPIQFEVFIKNTDTQERSFIISDILEQSIYFELRSSRNEIVEMNPKVVAQSSGVFSTPELYRNITLMPQESFSRLFDLREFYNITRYDTFYLKGIFYPDPNNRALQALSDYTVFSHIPSSTVLQQMVGDSINRSKELSILSTFLPNEIIKSFFESLFTKDWEKFLLHINTEQLLQSFQNYANQYNQSNDVTFKLELLKQFQRFLTVHWDIPLTSYKITQTTIQEHTAYVTVDAVESIRFTSRRVRYTFTLYRSVSGSWLIVDYTVLALN
ncbi:MAG: hypothetical protein ACRCWI_02655 [Brevinema sp.]